MEHFAKRVNGFQLLTIFAKRSMLDVCQCSKYTSINIYEQIFSDHIQVYCPHQEATVIIISIRPLTCLHSQFFSCFLYNTQNIILMIVRMFEGKGKFRTKLTFCNVSKGNVLSS